jgi:hypothetical protein
MASLASAVLQVGISQLAQHTARLQDAENENAALDALIPAWDEDMKAIAAAYNSGTSPSECISAASLVDSNAYAYLQKQVGKAGTSWIGQPNPLPTCNKQCTAGCCVYYNDLRPAIYGNPTLSSGMIPVLQKLSGQNVATNPGDVVGKSGGVQVPEIYPPSDTSYGNYSRAAYRLTLTTPPVKSSVAAAVLSASGSGTGFTIAAAPAPAPASPALPSAPPAGTTTATTSTSLSGALGLLTNAELVTIVGVVGGLLLIIAYLFGPNSVRVNS